VAPAYRRLSASPLWQAQRRFYESAGIEAWRTGTVPHHVTNSVALAAAWARVVCGFARDANSRQPVHVVELGAGSGRFAFLFLKALERLGAPGVRVRYVMTDVAPATIAFWARHPALRPFLRARRLDFARFDAERDRALTLRRARSKIASVAPVERLVVIANYVFSGLSQDAFVSRRGRLHEWLIHTAAPRRRPDAMVIKGRPGARAATPYDDEVFNRVLRQPHDARGVRLFPVGTLRALQGLATFAADDILVLVAERPDPSAGLDTATLGVGRHGAVSFPVDLAALHAWTRWRGGATLRANRPAQHLATTALLLGRRRRRWRHTESAWRRALTGGGPDAIYHQRRRLASIRTPPLRALLDLLRTSGPDPRVLAECLRPLWPHLMAASPELRGRLHKLVTEAWTNHYDIGDPHDVAFDLGLLLYAVRSWAGARRLFEASLRSHGDDAATHWNLALCHLALGHADAATTAFHEARVLAPGLNAAGPVTVKLGASRPVRVYARP
jgi:SAM-dependent methyltransferase